VNKNLAIINAISVLIAEIMFTYFAFEKFINKMRTQWIITSGIQDLYLKQAFDNSMREVLYKIIIEFTLSMTFVN